MKTPSSSIWLLPLALFCIGICIWIEILNQNAGGILPRELPESGNPKWRISIRSENSLAMQDESAYRRQHNLSPGATLPPHVEADIRNDARTSIAEAKLRGVVGSYGLLQYPASAILALAGTISSLRTGKKKNQLILLSLGSLGFLCLGIALYRAYFTSLGW
jgi:hypothetical protein